VCAFLNLLSAFRKAREGKRDSPEVAAYEMNLEAETIRLEQELGEGTYRPGGYRNFVIYEPKRRVISAAPFRDRVVHHAICNVIEPLFEERFIKDSYACRPGKGTHKALDRFTRFARRYPLVLKGDVVQYFPSIDHGILTRIVARRIRDRRLMALMTLLLDSGKDILKDEYEMAWFPGDDLFAALRPRGLPIGNLTSQFLANVYLDPLDHFVKEDLRARGYIRYCDDFVVFGETRERLAETRRRIHAFLAGLRLRLHERKTVVYRVRDGTPFLGFLVYPDHRRLLRRSVTRASRRFRALAAAYAAGDISPKELRQHVAAWIGHVKHGDTWGLRRRMLSRLRFVRGGTHAGNADLREDVRLEPVAVREDGGISEALPAHPDRAPGDGHPGHGKGFDPGKPETRSGPPGQARGGGCHTRLSSEEPAKNA
jgi:retron-type reverse transcriptase